jgi:spoIIIJ-associated protein
VTDQSEAHDPTEVEEVEEAQEVEGSRLDVVADAGEPADGLEVPETDVDADADAEAESDGESDADAEAAEPTGRRRRTSSETLESEAEIAADYLEELLDIADLDGDIDTYIEGDRAHVSIVSDSKVLVGDKGAVLDALQELARLAVMTETGERSRLMLDVAGFREQRRDELTKLAEDAVAEVKSSQQRRPLAPMNPFERKIVHDAVAAAGLTSASEGEEPQRRVVVLPAS